MSDNQAPDQLKQIRDALFQLERLIRKAVRGHIVRQPCTHEELIGIVEEAHQIIIGSNSFFEDTFFDRTADCLEDLKRAVAKNDEPRILRLAKEYIALDDDYDRLADEQDEVESGVRPSIE
jgi:hypothetical protein